MTIKEGVMNQDMEEGVLKYASEYIISPFKRLLNGDELNNEDYISIVRTHKEDCYFYNEVQDMSAHIPTCEYHHKLGHCPCDKCDKYIPKSDVYKIVKERVDSNDD